MKIKFRNVKLSKSNKQRLDQINEIIEEYQNQGYVLTLRQLYYQLVSRDIIPNKQAEYAKLSTLLKEGRMGGIVDWNAIEDRLRSPYSPASFDSPKDILDACINQYKLPRQKGQSNYIEVWVEKDALSGVLKRVTSKYHIPILVNRGYSSVSSMYESYCRFSVAVENGQRIKLIYLGDHDPSGMDMIRDVKDRIVEFFNTEEFHAKLWDNYDDKEFFKEQWYEELGEYKDDISEEDFKLLAPETYFKIWVEENFEVIPIALTKQQINFYNPPPNPAKITDPRSDAYISEHGGTSWEVDALPPEVLNQILQMEILRLIDLQMYEGIVSKEGSDILKLKGLEKYLVGEEE